MIDKKPIKFDLKKVKQEILDLKKSLMNLSFQKSSGQLEKTHQIRKTKKNIASLKTQISQNNGESNA